MRHARPVAADSTLEWSSADGAGAADPVRGSADRQRPARTHRPPMDIRIERATPTSFDGPSPLLGAGVNGGSFPSSMNGSPSNAPATHLNGGTRPERCISPLDGGLDDASDVMSQEASQMHTPDEQSVHLQHVIIPVVELDESATAAGELDMTDETLHFHDHYDVSDEELQEGECHYTANMKLLALESLAPKLHPHIWVVHQDSRGTVEVLTPTSFKEFLKVANPARQEGKERWWVDFQALSLAETRELGRLLGLHELTVEDMIAQDSPEKLENFNDAMYRYSMLMGMWPDTTRSSGWREVQLSCILTPNFFITLHQVPFVGLDEMLRRVRKDFVTQSRDRRARHQRHTSSTPRVMKGLWLYYCVYDILVDAIMPRVSTIRTNADQLDELILQLWGSDRPEMNEIMRMMAKNRKHINELRSLLAAKEALIRENKLERRAHYRDVLDHLSQMMTRLDSARDIVAQANSNYLAGVSVQAAVSANRTNEGMQKISMLAFAFVPMTLLTSLFGMNVQVPFQQTDSLLPFFLILLSFIFPVIGVALYVYREQHAQQQKGGNMALFAPAAVR